MIDSIAIHNIQSHKLSELDLHPRINVIVGSSNNGKTAILRALYWSVYNRPLGIDNLCSHWALDDKGNIKDEMSVEVRKGDDVLIRRKTKSVNQYVLNGNELNAIKTDVPPEVKDFYKLAETNIQKQQDAPFLVSSTSGEVAKYFNGIARLDIIDNVLAYAEQVKRKERNGLDDIEDRIRVQEELHKSFSWTEEASGLLDKIDRLTKKSDEMSARLHDMMDSVARYEGYEAELSSLADVEKGRQYIDSYDGIQNDLKCTSEEHDRLAATIARYDKLVDMCDLSLPVEAMKTYDEICESYKALTRDFIALQTSLYEYDLHVSTIEMNAKKIEEYKAKLPAICPLCGHEMKEEI